MSVQAKLAQARAIVKPVVKSETADAGKYEYSYASLSSVLKAVDEACNAVGLAWWQETEHLGDLNWRLVTVLYDPETDDVHRYGGAINTTKADPQANGSALTYARRYSLVLLFGMNQADDDGAMAHRAATDPQRRTEAEGQIRDGLKKLTKTEQKDFANDFQEEFKSTLTNLPEARHGDALGYWKFWSTASPETREDAREADEEETT
jgi:hypothetical protein